jgi:hypothetical protein
MDGQEQIVAWARELGHSSYRVSDWRKRGRVPHKHRLELVRYAAKHSVELSDADFENWRTKRGPRAGIASGDPIEARAA